MITILNREENENVIFTAANSENNDETAGTAKMKLVFIGDKIAVEVFELESKDDFVKELLLRSALFYAINREVKTAVLRCCGGKEVDIENFFAKSCTNYKKDL
jgi:hypothetical protein